MNIEENIRRPFSLHVIIQHLARQKQHWIMANVQKPSGWLGCVLIIALFFLCSFAAGLEAARKDRSRSVQPASITIPVIDELNGSSIGKPFGIDYVNAVNGQGAVFSRRAESRIQYPNTPSEGTLEWWINIRNGYRYVDYVVYENESSAMIFTTDVQGGDVTWPGSTWFFVGSDGMLSLVMATTKYDGPRQILKAEKTSFRFNQWHSLGISFGRQGQYLMLDGVLVASAVRNTQRLGRGGNHTSPIDVPTVGEAVSGVWSNNRYDGGFEGIVDRFRISNQQRDWYLSAQPPK